MKALLIICCFSFFIFPLRAERFEQGYRAATSGKDFENKVEAILRAHHFEVQRYSKWDRAEPAEGERLLLKHVPFTNIYKTSSYTEFLLKAPGVVQPIRIECKFQKVAGSADEKLPYLFLNATEAMPEDFVVIVIDGRGFREGAIAWLRKAVETQEVKKILVLDLLEFAVWADEVLSSPPTSHESSDN